MFVAESEPLHLLSPMRAALALAEASKIAYRGEGVAKRMLRTGGWEPLAHLRKTGGQEGERALCGFAARGQGEIVLAFRGADRLAEWLSQRSTEKRPIPEGAAHSGIAEELAALGASVDEIAGRAREEGVPVWLTGHGLGGAVALLAALRLDQEVRLVTFGQPRILDTQAAAVTEGRLAGRYWRIVNRDDMVPRIPPGFHHAGELCHFDLTGMLHPGGADGPEPLSGEEFAQLGVQMMDIFQRAFKDPQDAKQGDPGLAALFQASVEGLIGGVLSHRIDRYIEALRRWSRRERAQAGEAVEPVDSAVPLQVRLASGERPFAAMKEDPGVFTQGIPSRTRGGIDPGGIDPGGIGFEGIAAEETAGAGGTGALPTEAGTDDPLVPAVLTVQDDWEAPGGLRVLSRFGPAATVLMTPEEHQALRHDAQVSEIEISREAGVPDLNRSIPFARGEQVHAPPVGEKGDRCLFGLIDTGVDILHEAFSDGQGGTRIRAIWHQADDTGPSPHDVDPNAFSQDYGRLYLGDELDALVKGFHQNSPPVSDALRDDWNLFSSGHGTHVASIGAGGPFGALGGGMAPEAPIVAVIPNLKSDPASPHSLGYSLTHVDAVHFLNAVANAKTKVFDQALPMVVNVSLGMNAGPHDGKTPLEVAFTMATSDGTKRGFAIVKSAGNEAGRAGHARINAATGSRSVIGWEAGPDDRDSDYLEVWYEDIDDLRFRLRPPGVSTADDEPDISVDSDPANRLSLVRFGGNTIQLQLVPGTGHGSQLTVEIKSGSRPIAPGRWRLDVLGRRIDSENGIVDAWIERSNQRPVRFVSPDDDYTISIPGTVGSVICVGASDCAPDFPAIADFSSRGLTRDAIQKPDITAPGVAITAARAGRADLAATVSKDGTSMAAPHVAGAIALVLSRRQKDIEAGRARRQFTAAQLLDGLKFSARDRTLHRLDWGHGKLDAEAFFNRMMAL